MFRLIILQDGYAESSTAAWLPFGTVTGRGFSTAREALSELALDLYAKAFEEHGQIHRPCKHTIPAGAAFCPTCGNPQAKPESLDAETYVEFIRELWGADCDSYGYDPDLEHADGFPRKIVWSPWEAKFQEPRQIIFIPVEASQVMAAVLKETLPEFAAHNKDWEPGPSAQACFNKVWKETSKRKDGTSQAKGKKK